MTNNVELAMSNHIAGIVVVITGASSGLGEATARLLSAEGASVGLGARRVDRLQPLAAELTGRGGKALAVATDVTDRDQVKRLVDAAVQTYGRLDVMINNAGLMQQSPLVRLKVDEWDNMIDINIKGVLYGIARRAAARAAAEGRPHHQRLLRGRTQGDPRGHRLLGDQARGAGHPEGTAEAGKPPKPPHDGHPPGRAPPRPRAAEPHHGPGIRREHPEVL